MDIVGDLSGKTDTWRASSRVSERSTFCDGPPTTPIPSNVSSSRTRSSFSSSWHSPIPHRAPASSSAHWSPPTWVALTPIVCLTKSDLEPPEEFASTFADLDIQVVVAGRDDPLDELTQILEHKLTALIGHSGVGKSTLVNRLVPDANRAVGIVSGVGKGRHTSTQSVALPLAGGGWVIDTPGIRSFGLAHNLARET